MKTVMVWETLPFISGGQSMTLLVCDLLKTEYNFVFLLPQEGALSDALDSRGIKYFFLGDQTLPCGVKGKKAIPLYAKMSFTAITKAQKIVKRIKPDLIYVPGPAALPWGAVIGMLSHLPVVWHLHHLFLDGMTKKLLNSCSRLKAVKRIIGISKCVAIKSRLLRDRVSC